MIQRKHHLTILILVVGIGLGIGIASIFGAFKSNAQTTIPATTSAPSCSVGGGCGCGGGTKTTTSTTVVPLDKGGSGAGSEAGGFVSAATTSSYETVNVGHTAFALNPETVTLKAGKSYKLVITPTENGGGCMGTMTFPGLDENVYPVRAGSPVTVTIDNAQAGTYDVVCGAMGMYQGSIIIQ